VRVRRKRVLIPKRETGDANHLVYARLTTPHGVVPGVLCEVFLPKFKSKEPCFKFYPTAKQSDFLQHIWAFDLSATIRNAGRTITLRADEVMSSGLATGVRDGIPFLHSFDGSPLSVERTIASGRGNGKRIVKGAFHLTACPVINTASIIERSYTGDVNIKRIVVPTFTLGCGLKLEFKKHFEMREGKEKESITTSHLTAEFEATTPLPRVQFPEAAEEFQEFLTLASFASRYRCVCARWNAVDDRGSLTEHFQQNLLFPDAPQPGPEQTLIDLADFIDFAGPTFTLYRSFADRSFVNNAMFALAGERPIVNDRFLVFFTALESLLLHARHSTGKAKGKASLKDLFDDFQQSYSVDISDLWPLIDRSKGRSLKDIRNRIAHGQPLSSREEYFLSWAVENLRWLVERMLLAILKWPVRKSKACKEFLTYFTAHDWSHAITQFR
jgi:hypothetical protein